MTTRWARFVRGWGVAGFSVFVAALSHTLGGGSAPGALAVVLSLAFGGIVCIGLAGSTLSLWRVGLSVLASQLIFHGLFAMGGAGGGLSAAPTAHHQAVSVILGAPGSASVHAAGHDGAMWFAHAAAGALTIAALRRGEAAIRSLCASAGLVIRSLFEPLVALASPAAPRCTPSTARVFPPRDLGVLLGTRWRRGPPLRARAA